MDVSLECTSGDQNVDFIVTDRAPGHKPILAVRSARSMHEPLAPKMGSTFMRCAAVSRYTIDSDQAVGYTGLETPAVASSHL